MAVRACGHRRSGDCAPVGLAGEPVHGAVVIRGEGGPVALSALSGRAARVNRTPSRPRVTARARMFPTIRSAPSGAFIPRALPRTIAPMLEPLDLGVLRDFATALLIGALVGVEREKRKAEEDKPGIAGLRTFILVALIGAVAGYLAQTAGLVWLLPVTVLAVAGQILAGYVVMARKRSDLLGLTTELAAVAVCLLGAMAMFGHRDLAIGLGVVTAGAGLQAAPARARRQARLGRRLCRRPPADRDLHHPAAAAGPPARPLGP